MALATVIVNSLNAKLDNQTVGQELVEVQQLQGPRDQTTIWLQFRDIDIELLPWVHLVELG